MHHMSKVVIASFALLTATEGITANVYWKTWLVLPTVYDFNTDANWTDYPGGGNNAYVPGTNDIANFTFWLSAYTWTTRNWGIHFSAGVTNNAAVLNAPMSGCAGTLDLGGQSWTMLNNFSLSSGRGGRVVLTNGVLDVAGNILLSATTDLSGLATNAILIANDMQMKCKTMNIDSTHIECNGGNLTVTNGLGIGSSSAWAGTLASFVLDRAGQCTINGSCNVGAGSGTTGIFENVTGNVVVTNQLTIGSAGKGTLALYGGTFTNTSSSAWHYIGMNAGATGVLDVRGGTNLLAATSASAVLAGRFGHGCILGSGGLTTIKSTLYLAYYDGSEAEMTLSGGRWDITGVLMNGRNGQAHFTCSGGELNVSGGLYLGTGTNGISDVDITGGKVTSGGDLPMGWEIGVTAALRLSGDGVLTCGRIYKKKNDASIQTSLTFDGGMLQARTSGTLIDLVDSVYLGTNGLVVNSAGNDVSIVPTLQDVSGQAGSLTKLGPGTVTLAAGRTATGPVSVEAGTLIAGDNLAVAEGVSRINGTLTLTSGALSLAAGTTLAGTGMVSSVSMADGTVFSRAKTDGATTPLQSDSFTKDGTLTIALTGYTIDDLRAALPLIRTSSPLSTSAVTVTLDGETQPRVCAIVKTDQGQNLLVVEYVAGTLLSVY